MNITVAHNAYQIMAGHRKKNCIKRENEYELKERHYPNLKLIIFPYYFIFYTNVYTLAVYMRMRARKYKYISIVCK